MNGLSSRTMRVLAATVLLMAVVGVALVWFYPLTVAAKLYDLPSPVVKNEGSGQVARTEAKVAPFVSTATQRAIWAAERPLEDRTIADPDDVGPCPPGRLTGQKVKRHRPAPQSLVPHGP